MTLSSCPASKLKTVDPNEEKPKTTPITEAILSPYHPAITPAQLAWLPPSTAPCARLTRPGHQVVNGTDQAEDTAEARDPTSRDFLGPSALISLEPIRLNRKPETVATIAT